jgi:hypothetical protein
MPCLIRKLRTFVVLSKFESILSVPRMIRANRSKPRQIPIRSIPYIYHRCAVHGCQVVLGSSAQPTRGITAALGCHLAVQPSFRGLVR